MKRSIIHWLYFGLMAMVTLVSCGKEEDPGNGGQGGQGGQGGNTTVKVTGVTVSPKTGELQPGGTLQLQATVTPDNATSKRVKWTSSNTAVATVDDKGLVTAVANGTATITATSTDASTSNPPSDNCAITVNSPQEGSHQGPVTDKDFGGNGSGGDTLDPGYKPDIDDDGPTQNGYSYTYGDHTVEVTDELLKKMSDVSDEGFSLPGDDNGNSSIWEGDIFVFPISEQFPNGSAQKVISKTTYNGGKTWKYKTDQAALDEIFKDLHMSLSQFDISPYVLGLIDEEGNEMDATPNTKGGFTISIPKIFGFEGLGIEKDLGDNLTISPSIDIGFNLSMGADVVDYSLLAADAKLDVSLHLGADFVIKGATDKEWKSRMISVVVGAIPIGPLVITPEPFIQFVLKLSGEVNLTVIANYEKGLKVRALYDGSEVKTRTAFVDPKDRQPLVSLAGDLSGGIEVGPNFGFALSIYRGALGLGLDLEPRLALNVTSSYPFTMETLKNYLGGYGVGEWLSDAYFEPSFRLGFGGHIQLAYKWYKKFEIPENMTLSYSTGKTFIMPKLGKDLNIKSKSGMAQVTTTIRNRALFDDNMYIRVHKGGTNGDVFGVFPFEVPQKPEKEDDEVDCTAYIRGLEEDTIYYVDGPFMELDAFGLNAEVRMAPYQSSANRFIDYFNQDIASALKEILGDIYQSRVGEWTHCNWDEDLDDPREYTNVYISATSDAGEKHFVIELNPDWKLNGAISVGDHSQKVQGKLKWDLDYLGDFLELDELVIKDKTFGRSNILPKKKLTINSPAYGLNTFIIDNKTAPQKEQDYFMNLAIDLSETNVEHVAFGTKVGSVKLNNCPSLSDVSFSGPYQVNNDVDIESFDIESIPYVPLPQSINVSDCPKFDFVWIGNGRLDGFREAMKNYSFVPLIRIAYGTAKELNIPDCCEKLEFVKGYYDHLVIGGSERLKTVDFHLKFYPPTVRALTIEDCPVYNNSANPWDDNTPLDALESITVQRCPSLTGLHIVHRRDGGGFTVNIHNMSALRIMKVSSSGSSPIDFTLSLTDTPSLEGGIIEGEAFGGIVPDGIRDSIIAGTSAWGNHHRYWYNYDSDAMAYTSYTDTGYGFYYPGEPEQLYHRNPDYPNND